MTSLNLVAYARMGLCNPVSEAAIGAALDHADLKPGERAAELGCGNGALALLLARRGLAVEAYDRGGDMAELARRRAAEAGLPVVVRQGEADALAQAGAPWRLVAALGTTALADFGRLSSWLASGGWLLWGDLFWAAEPGPALRAAMGHPDYETDEGWRARGRAAGLELVHARISDRGDWAAYASDLSGAVADWAAENPDHPRREAIQNRAAALAAWRAGPAHEALGFGLYLFRKP